MSFERIEKRRGNQSLIKKTDWGIAVYKKGITVFLPFGHPITKSTRVYLDVGRGEDEGWLLISTTEDERARKLLRPSSRSDRVLIRTTTLPKLPKDFLLPITPLEFVDIEGVGTKIWLPWFDKKEDEDVVKPSDGDIVAPVRGIEEECISLPDGGDTRFKGTSIIIEAPIINAPDGATGGGSGPDRIVPISYVDIEDANFSLEDSRKDKPKKSFDPAFKIPDTTSTPQPEIEEKVFRFMSLEQAAEYLRQKGRKCVIRIGKPRRDTMAGWVEIPVPVLDGEEVSIKKLFLVLNGYRLAANQPPINPPPEKTLIQKPHAIDQSLID